MKSLRCPCGRPLPLPTVETLAATSLTCACGATLELATQDQVDYATYIRNLQPPDRAEPCPIETCYLLLITKTARARRIDQQAFDHYLAAMHRVVVRFLLAQPEAGECIVQIACGLVPGASPAVEIFGGPDHSPLIRQLGGLEATIKQLPAPPVYQGPVPFYLEGRRGDPSATESVELPPPFSSFNRSRRQRSIEDLVLEARGVHRYSVIWGSIPAQARWRQVARHVLKRWWRRQCGPETAEPEVAEPFPPPDFPINLESVTERIEAYPLDSRWRQVRAELFAQSGDWTRAAEDMRHFVTDHPADTLARVHLARYLRAGGERSAALAELDIALKTDPTNVTALMARAQGYFDLGAWDAALADLRFARECDPLDPTPPFHASLIAASRQRLPEAIDLVTAALRLDPHWAEAYEHRARLRAEMPCAPESRADRRVEIEADLTAAIIRSPSSQFSRCMRADLFLGAGRPVPALMDCLLALRHFPDQPHVLGLRGMARLMLGDPQGTIEDGARCRAAGVANAGHLTSMAQAQLMLGQFDQAQDLCAAALELDERSAFAHYLRSQAREQLGQWEAALEDAATAVALAPDVAEWRAQHGYLLLVMGDDAAALAEAEEAARQQPRLASAHLVRSKVSYKQKNYKEAVAALDRCLENASDHAEARFMRGEIRLRQQEPRWALTDLDAAIRAQPQVPAGYLARAQARAELGELDSAIADLDRVIQLYPDAAQGYASRGHVWILKGDPDRAEADYREAIALDPGCAEDLFAQRLMVEAGLLRKKERYREATAKATEAIERQESATAYLTRASARWLDEEFVDAIEDVERAIELEADPVFAYHMRGRLLGELGRFEESLEDLNRAGVAADPLGSRICDAGIANGRARALTGLGRLEEAAAEFETAVRLCPENAWVHYNHGLMYREMGEWTKAVVCFKLALVLDDPPLSTRRRIRAQAFVQQVEARSTPIP